MAPFLAFGGVMAVGIGPHGHWRDARMRRRLAREGRVMSWDDVEGAAANGGTIVTDYPSAGWSALRVWWTSDDVEYEAPDGDAPRVTDPRHRAFIEHYASPASPSAKLVAFAYGQRATQELEQHIAAALDRCPALKRATLASGILLMMQQKKDAPAQPTSSNI